MPPSDALTISPAPELRRVIAAQQAASGRGRAASEAVRAGLRLRANRPSGQVLPA